MLFCLITRTHAIASCETRTSPSVRARSLCIRRILSKSAEALSRPSRSPLLLPPALPKHTDVKPIISASLVPPSYASFRGLVTALSVLPSSMVLLGARHRTTVLTYDALLNGVRLRLHSQHLFAMIQSTITVCLRGPYLYKHPPKARVLEGGRVRTAIWPIERMRM